MKIHSAAGGPGGCHTCMGDRDRDPLCCRLLAAHGHTGHPSLVAGLSRVWGPPSARVAIPQPCLALAAVKESSPCEWWELPWLRSRSTSAPLQEPAPQLQIHSPLHCSTWQPCCTRPPPPTSPFGVPEGYPSGQGLWGALPCGRTLSKGLQAFHRARRLLRRCLVPESWRGMLAYLG